MGELVSAWVFRYCLVFTSAIPTTLTSLTRLASGFLMSLVSQAARCVIPPVCDESAMSTITLLYFASLQAQAQTATEVINLAAGGKPATVYQQLQQQYGFSLTPAQLRAAVNHAMARWDQVLNDGDILAFIPPVSGG